MVSEAQSYLAASQSSYGGSGDAKSLATTTTTFDLAIQPSQALGLMNQREGAPVLGDWPMITAITIVIPVRQENRMQLPISKRVEYR